MTPVASQNPKRRRLWFQFRLSSLVIAITLLCIGFAWVARERSKLERQREVVAAIQARGGHAGSMGTQTRPSWLRFLLSDDSSGIVDFVGFSSQLGDEDLPYLAAFPHLLHLHLNGSNVSNGGMNRLKDIRTLETLSLPHRQPSDTGLAHLKSLSNLRRLDLNCADISDAGIFHLKDLRKIEELTIVGSPITDESLAHLSKLLYLKTLYLTRTNVTGSGLWHLKDSKDLETLYLTDTPVTDSALVHLKPFQKLKTLDLSRTSISDVGLVHLAELKQLTFLNLGSTKVTDEGVKKLQRALPKLKIDREGVIVG